MDQQDEKIKFLNLLKDFALSLNDFVSVDHQWTIRGFIDIDKNIYHISSDTKIISKLLELHIFPNFFKFAEQNGFKAEPAKFQNWYPDITLTSKSDENVKFAVDLKTTYRNDRNSEFCNGFTLGSHSTYFTDRNSTKNIQYPYHSYLGHFCLGIIYTRRKIKKEEETKIYSINEIEKIKPVISDFIFFAEEKWKIASDKSGSGNTANIGSIQKIDDILKGNGMFAKAGERIFDDYWANYGNLQILDENGDFKVLTSLREYLTYRGLSMDIYNPKASKKKGTK